MPAKKRESFSPARLTPVSDTPFGDVVAWLSSLDKTEANEHIRFALITLYHFKACSDLGKHDQQKLKSIYLRSRANIENYFNLLEMELGVDLKKQKNKAKSFISENPEKTDFSALGSHDYSDGLI